MYTFCVRNVFDRAGSHLKNAYALVFINSIGLFLLHKQAIDTINDNDQKWVVDYKDYTSGSFDRA